jgi:hypothetical protein
MPWDWLGWLRPGNGVDPVADVAPMLRLAPNFSARLESLLEAGWKIRYTTGRSDRRAHWDGWAHAESMEILVGRANRPYVLQTLAHEVGHALDPATKTYAVERPTRREYVQENVARALRQEARATLEGLAVRNEILRNGGGDIGFEYAGADRYLEIARRKDLTRQEKVQAIADVFGDTESYETGKTYRQSFTDMYRDSWRDSASARGINGVLQARLAASESIDSAER